MYISELSFQKETCSRCWLGYVGISRVKRVLKASSRRSFKTRPPLIIHCAAHRHIDALTFKHGESLEDLETAIKSASWESWEHAFQLNVLAPYFSTAGFTKPIGTAAKKGSGSGSVIHFNSPSSVHNYQFVLAYQTSKAAVDHLVRMLAAEFAHFYIKYSFSSGLVSSLTYQFE